MEASVRAALHDAIVDRSGPLERFYRAELAELEVMREALIPAPRSEDREP